MILGDFKSPIPHFPVYRGKLEWQWTKMAQNCPTYRGSPFIETPFIEVPLYSNLMFNWPIRKQSSMRGDIAKCTSQMTYTTEATLKFQCLVYETMLYWSNIEIPMSSIRNYALLNNIGFPEFLTLLTWFRGFENSRNINWNLGIPNLVIRHNVHIPTSVRLCGSTVFNIHGVSKRLVLAVHCSGIS